MKRRNALALLAGAAMLRPFAARAAGEPAKVFRLGVLFPAPPATPYRAFVEQLQLLGYEEGRICRSTMRSSTALIPTALSR